MVAVFSKAMLGWKIAAMVCVVLGSLLAGMRTLDLWKVRLPRSGKEVGAWMGFLPFVISGYFAFSYVPHRTGIGPWLASVGWLRWPLLGSIFLIGAFIVIYVGIMFEKGPQRLFQSEGTTLALSILLIGAASFIQIFILNP